jgi:hypothetical protein
MQDLKLKTDILFEHSRNTAEAIEVRLFSKWIHRTMLVFSISDGLHNSGKELHISRIFTSERSLQRVPGTEHPLSVEISVCFKISDDFVSGRF